MSCEPSRRPAPRRHQDPHRDEVALKGETSGHGFLEKTLPSPFPGGNVPPLLLAPFRNSDVPHYTFSVFFARACFRGRMHMGSLRLVHRTPRPTRTLKAGRRRALLRDGAGRAPGQKTLGLCHSTLTTTRRAPGARGGEDHLRIAAKPHKHGPPAHRNRLLFGGKWLQSFLRGGSRSRSRCPEWRPSGKDRLNGLYAESPMQRSKRTGERILRSARLRLHCLLDGEQSDVNEPRTGRTAPTRG
jgi:hypothetical protein